LGDQIIADSDKEWIGFYLAASLVSDYGRIQCGIAVMLALG